MFSLLVLSFPVVGCVLLTEADTRELTREQPGWDDPHSLARMLE